MTTEAERLRSNIRAASKSFEELEALYLQQAAEIERLKAESGRWIDLAGHWAQECKTEQRLSFREQVGKLEAEIERANALLRQALGAMQHYMSGTLAMPRFVEPETNAAIDAIKQHLWEHHGD